MYAHGSVARSQNALWWSRLNYFITTANLFSVREAHCDAFFNHLSFVCVFTECGAVRVRGDPHHRQHLNRHNPPAVHVRLHWSAAFQGTRSHVRRDHCGALGRCVERFQRKGATSLCLVL